MPTTTGSPKHQHTKDFHTEFNVIWEQPFGQVFPVCPRKVVWKLHQLKHE